MIKVTIGGKPQKKQIPFPKLMIYTSPTTGNRTIIVATSRCTNSGDYTGTCIYTESGDGHIGEISKKWSSDYQDLNEPITLQNITE